MAMGISFGVCTLGIGIAVNTYNTYIHQEQEALAESYIDLEELDIEEKKESEKEVTEEEPLELDTRINKTVAVFGTDIEGLRTDVIIVVNFNSETNKVHAISVPRDTKVDWKTSQKAVLPDKYSWVQTSKINEMTVWGGMNQIRETTIKELEYLLGIKIDNYVIVSLNAFREIIDAIGGIEFEVPQRMIKDDYSQNLHINLYPGLQHLDGDKAEQLVRFRDYVNGDLGRIKVQQTFLNEVAKKVLSPGIITKIPSIVPVLLNSVKTDIGLVELPTFYPYMKSFDINNLSFHMLPGIDMYQNNISYYIPDLEKTEQLVQQIFFGELFE